MIWRRWQDACLLALASLSIMWPAAASSLPKEVVVNGVEFILIPAGEFTYTVETGGALRDMRPGQPYNRQVQIWLDDFYIAKFEARARDLVRFLNSPAASAAFATDYRAGWHEPDQGCTVKVNASGKFEILGKENLPATGLSWNQARAFAHWMGFRLPSEAEWQKAARGVDERIWPWGNILGDDTYANFSMGSLCRPVAVDSYSRGRSPYGAYQMAGNVSEYVADWYNEDFDAALTDGDRNPSPASTASPVPFEGPRRISKGGDWSPNVTMIAIGFRSYVDPDRTSSRDGVRFALNAEEVEKLLLAGEAQEVFKQTRPANDAR